MRGTIKTWLAKRQIGFIRPADRSAGVFFHRSVWRGDAEPVLGAAVEYEPVRGEKGLRAAYVVQLAGESARDREYAAAIAQRAAQRRRD
jgi:cold shock CspA family protein